MDDGLCNGIHCSSHAAVEEPALKAQFGESYRAYRRAVPRWGFTTRPYKEGTGSTA
jgi:hypothetical protein